MTNAIEVTKRKLYEEIRRANEMASIQHLRAMGLPIAAIEERLEAHLEELRKAMVAINESTMACAQHSSEAFVEQERRIMALTTERDTLRNRVQVLELANQTSGDVIRSLKQEVGSLKREASQARKNLMAARLADLAASVSVPPYNASGATLDSNTATILGALVDAQRIMTDYLVPDGIRAKDAMGKIIPVLDNEKLCLAMDAFEQPKEEITGASLSAKYFSNRTIASVAIDKMVRNLMRGKSGCMHSFHSAFPSGELCTFCGVGK